MKKESNDIDPLAKERDLTGKKIVRRRDANKVVPPEALEPRNIKVQVSIKLDADILEHFEELANRPGAQPYQAQINQALRGIVDRESDGTSGAVVASDDESPERLIEEIKYLLPRVTEPTRQNVLIGLRACRDVLEERAKQNSRKLA